MSLANLQRLAEGGDFKQVEASAEKQVGELDGLLLEFLFRQGGSNPGGGSGGGGHLKRGSFDGRGPDQGNRVLLRRKRVVTDLRGKC